MLPVSPGVLTEQCYLHGFIVSQCYKETPFPKSSSLFDIFVNIVIFRIHLLDILWNIFEQIALVPNEELYLISEIFL